MTSLNGGHLAPVPLQLFGTGGRFSALQHGSRRGDMVEDAEAEPFVCLGMRIRRQGSLDDC